MVYRPMVRYSDSFRKYIESLYESTHLDRNQIIRLALFIAAYSPEYQSILKKYQRPDTTLPQANWTLNEEQLWRNQNYVPKTKRQEIPANSEVIKVINKGGIKYVPKTSPLSNETNKSVTL